VKVKVKPPRSRSDITEDLYRAEIHIGRLRERLMSDGPEQLDGVPAELKSEGSIVVRLAEELDRPPWQPQTRPRST
jgi:hypothetical protein